MFTSRNMVVLFKKEATPYTDPSPTPAANSVPVMNESSGISWGVTGTGAQKVSSPFGGEVAEVMATRKPTFSYTIPFYGKGLTMGGVIVYPRWVTDILSTCFDTFVGPADPSQLLLSPNPFYPINTSEVPAVTENKRTFTIYEFKGLDGAYVGGSKTLTKLVGCRLTRVAFAFKNGVPLTITIEGVGLYDSDAATVTTDLSGTDNDGYSGSDNVVMNGLQSEITPAGGAAIAAIASSLDLTFDFAAEHIEGDDARSGVAATSITDISVSGAINPIVEPGDVGDWLDLVSSKLPFAIGAATNGVYPDTRSANTGFGIRPAVAQGQAQADTLARDRAVLDLPLTFIATRPSISGAPATIQIL